MRLRLVTKEIEVPDEIGDVLLQKQKKFPKQFVSQHVYDDPWSYEVKVPAQWEVLRDSSNSH